MHTEDPQPWQHDHVFGLDQRQAGEPRVRLVVLLTGVTMVAEIIAGLAFGSMALLADGLHMASHTLALGIALFAYIFARRHAGDARFSFGTGKVNALGGFTGAILLLVFALGMAAEGIRRLAWPVEIAFDLAILVAFLGLIVNVVSARILMGAGHAPDGAGAGHPGHVHPAHDHNLHSAYLHVLADALTSVLAIGALLIGKYLGASWLDPAMGVVGAVVIARWSVGLLRDSGKTLLDWQAPQSLRDQLLASLERDGDRVTDLHLWSVGPGVNAAAVSLVTDQPATAAAYHARAPHELRIVHMTVEVLHRSDPRAPRWAG